MSDDYQRTKTLLLSEFESLTALREKYALAVKACRQARAMAQEDIDLGGGVQFLSPAYRETIKNLDKVISDPAATEHDGRHA